jgi:pyruvate/2-oxoglutarate dehydrogenase complex dihydrolipoamide acyltransferase (E2) component
VTEQTHHLQVSVLIRKHQGRGAHRCCLVRAGAGLAEQTHDLQVSVLRRKLEGRIWSRLVRVGAGLTEQTHILKVSVQTQTSRPWHHPAAPCPCRRRPHRADAQPPGVRKRRKYEGRAVIRCILALVGPGVIEQTHHLQVSVRHRDPDEVAGQAVEEAQVGPARCCPVHLRHAGAPAQQPGPAQPPAAKSATSAAARRARERREALARAQMATGHIYG